MQPVYLFILYFSSMEALLAWQPPRTNESSYLCSLIFTVPDNVQKHWREREREGGMTKESSMDVHVHTNLTILQCSHLDAPVQYPNLHLDGVQHLKQLTHTQIILLKFVVT